MLLQQGNACPFEPAGGGSDRHTPRSRLLGRRTIITRFGALGAPTTTYDNIENTHLFRPRRDQCTPVCISVCIPEFRPIEHLKSVTLIARPRRRSQREIDTLTLRAGEHLRQNCAPLPQFSTAIAEPESGY
jgi:hypothetical protein